MNEDVPKILVVDDEPDLLATLQYRLRQEGWEVLVARNGLEGLGAVRAKEPDLIILDVMLPGENGYRVAKMIREDEKLGVYPRRTPILLLTARDLSGDPDREKMFMEFSQADRMMYKPFDMVELLGTVRALLDPVAVS